MAKYSINTSNALTKKAWEEKLYRDGVKESYFMPRFAGESNTSLMQVKTQLEKSKGDNITFGLRKRLEGAGVTEGVQLEGNEESLSLYSDSVTLAQYRHAVRGEQVMTVQRASFAVTEEMRDGLKDWQAEKIDQLAFDALMNDPTKVIYKNGSGVKSITDTPSTAQGVLSATNSKFSLDLLSFIRAGAKTGWNRTQTPLKPIKIGGKEYFVFLTHPEVVYDIKASSEWQTAQREAQARGGDNPLFTGAVGIWDNIVIHEHENVPVASDGGGASVHWCKSVFMGQQSLVWAWGKRPKMVQETFDYENELGVSTEIVAGVKKPIFDGNDYGSVGVYLACTNVSA